MKTRDELLEMKPEQLSVGLKVQYSPAFGPPENGMVKSWNKERAWVVYKCGGEWKRFQDFTGCPTTLEDLRPGWIDAAGKQRCKPRLTP